MPPLKIGTRGSPLALAQTGWVVERLRDAQPNLAIEVVVIRTAGDRSQALPPTAFAGRGIFVTEIEQALARAEIDAAVHSLKDLPATLQAGFAIAAIPPREDPRDALHTATSGVTWDTLARGARVGTSSQRRTAQLRYRRPDLQFFPIRGNVGTRVERVARGDYDAIIVAAAGLRRLGMATAIRDYLDYEVCLPEAGQGAIGIEVRADDPVQQALFSVLDHGPTRVTVEAERAAVAAIGGGCTTPTAAYAEIDHGTLWLRGVVASPDGTRLIAAEIRAPIGDHAAAPALLAQELIRRGAAELV